VSTTVTTDQVAAVPDEPGVTMKDLVLRWRAGDLSAARPLIDMLGSTLSHVISQRDNLAYRLSCAQAELAKLQPVHLVTELDPCPTSPPSG
jgi:hypothetical protein